MGKTVYKITVLNWEKHNPKTRKGYTHFMVSKSIFNDHKISRLKPVEIVLYLYCLSVCADMTSSCIRITYNMIPRYLRINIKMLSRCLLSLEQNQLLTLAEFRHENCKLIEQNRIEENISEGEKKSAHKNSENPKKENSTKNFEDRFKQAPEIEELKGALNILFDKRIPPFIKNRLTQMINFMEGDFEKVKEAIEEIARNPKAQKQSNQDYRPYLTACITKEFGLKEEGFKVGA